jgi:hypothetical protein
MTPLQTLGIRSQQNGQVRVTGITLKSNLPSDAAARTLVLGALEIRLERRQW